MLSSLGNFVKWLNTNAVILGIVMTIFLAIIPAAWSFIRYLSLKSKELRFERFKIYHQLVRELVEPEAEGRGMMLDRQIAIVFELRNFPEYHEVTLRMLEGLKRSWDTGHPKFKRLLDEMDLTIGYIRAKVKVETEQEKQVEA